MSEINEKNREQMVAEIQNRYKAQLEIIHQKQEKKQDNTEEWNTLDTIQHELGTLAGKEETEAWIADLANDEE